MKNDSNSETNAAVQTAGRELITSVLQRNPIVAVATALIGPIIGLFKRRRPATSTRSRSSNSKATGPLQWAARIPRCLEDLSGQ